MPGDVDEWIRENPWLYDFENRNNKPKTWQKKWELYFQIQESLKEIPRFVSNKAKISKTAEIIDNVVIMPGAQVMPGAFIAGPAYIGKNVMVGNSALIRPGSFISNNCIIGNHCYCIESVLGPWSGAFHFTGVSRSFIESNVRMSIFVITATTRVDLKPIKIANFDGRADNYTKIGCLIGENTFVCPHALIGPGVSIGSNCFIGSFTSVFKDIPNNTKITAKIENRISENSLVTEKHQKPPSINISMKRENTI
jgi:UDP-3-O-[3-hydroxymyristoyl] glucosamine N-acyltransferase